MKTTIEFDVPPAWIDYVTTDFEIFNRNYCGYWGAIVESHEFKGFLVWEHNDERPSDEGNEHDPAMVAFEYNTPLPKRYFRLDKAAAVRAYAEGVRRWGVGWYEGGDASKYDIVIQMALLGEVRYG